MRAFDVLTKAEYDIRSVDAAALSPRDGAAALDPPAQAGAAHRPDRGARQTGRAGRVPDRAASADRPPSPRLRRASAAPPRPARASRDAAAPPREAARTGRRRHRPRAGPPAPRRGGCGANVRRRRPAIEAVVPQLKDAFLGEIQKAKKFFYGTVVAQAQRIEVEPATRSSSRSRRSTARCARSSSRTGRGSKPLATQLAGRPAW